MSTENGKAVAAYYNVIGAMKSDYYKSIPHEFSPCHNLHKTPNVISWNPNFVASSIKTFPYSSTLPTPILPPTKLNTHNSHNIQDPALNLIIEKEIWQRKINKMKYKYKKEMERIPNARFSKKGITVPQFLIHFTEMLSEDPDSQFNGTYDWYYTGGNLQVTKLGNQQLLLQPSGRYSDYLSVIPFDTLKDEHHATIHNATITRAKRKHQIYEIISRTYNHSDIQSIFVGARQKYCFTVYEIVETENSVYAAEAVSKVKTKRTLTSACFDNYFEGKFCTVNTDRCISIYDINSTNSSKYNIKVETSNSVSNKWSCIKYSDVNNIVYADRCCVQMFDTRINQSENVTNVYCPKDVLDKCDEISAIVLSKLSNNYIYLGTNHNLFLADIRMLNSSKRIPLQRWTHMMKSTPCMLDTLILDETELIHISSPLVGDNRLIVNGYNKQKIDMDENNVVNEDFYITDSVSLPWLPPSILDSLHLTKNSGLYLDPTSHVKERLNLCITGSLLLKNVDNTTLLTQNSVGDIFQQRIVSNCEGMLNDSGVVKQLHRWNKTLMSITKSHYLEMTSALNMKPVGRIMKSNKSKIKDINIEKQKRMGRWQQPISRLVEYKDSLATDLLEAWGFEETSADQGFIPSQLNKSTSHQDKVSAWLQNTSPDPTEMSQNFDSQQSEPIVLSCPEPAAFINYSISQNDNNHLKFLSQPMSNNKLNMSRKSTKPQRKRPRLNDGF